MEFDAWFKTFILLSEKRGFPVAVNDKDSYREYFDDGCSPDEALEDEINHADWGDYHT